MQTRLSMTCYVVKTTCCAKPIEKQKAVFYNEGVQHKGLTDTEEKGEKAMKVKKCGVLTHIPR